MQDNPSYSTEAVMTSTDGLPASPALLDVKAVAALLNVSQRTVYRLADAGKMPPPLHLGALVRWPSEVIAQWIRDGCPTVRKGAGR
jgi:excisionase family DNA binding protein